MKTLILSCNTGEGHNSCAKAIQEYFHAESEECIIEDALCFLSPGISEFMSVWHSRIYRYIPWLFNFGYQYAEKHPSVFRENTWAYRFLTRGTQRLHQHILEGGYDCIICTHVFSALAVTDILKKYPISTTTCFVATDYTCSPSTKDSNLDYYFIPDLSLANEYMSPSIPVSKIVGSGIPVRQMFYMHKNNELAKEALGIPSDHKHLLMMCGSMGCGPIKQLAKFLAMGLQENQDLTIVCGTNQRLQRYLERKFGDHSNLHVMGYVEDMSLLMDSADLYLTKPGGISVTEAAVKKLPMVFVNAVAGCEAYNGQHYIARGCAQTCKSAADLSGLCIALLTDDRKLEQMKQSLFHLPQQNAAQMIYYYLKKQME